MSKSNSGLVKRRGDQGQTSLGDGTRVFKHEERIEAMGAVEELNAQLGVLIAELNPDDAFGDELKDIQTDLFEMVGELSAPGDVAITKIHIAKLEMLIDALSNELDGLESFVMPGGCRPVALAHLLNSVARRCERRLISLSVKESVNPASRVYLNRLSDYFLLAARWMARQLGEADVVWNP